MCALSKRTRVWSRAYRHGTPQEGTELLAHQGLIHHVDAASGAFSVFVQTH